MARLPSTILQSISLNCDGAGVHGRHDLGSIPFLLRGGESDGHKPVASQGISSRLPDASSRGGPHFPRQDAHLPNGRKVTEQGPAYLEMHNCYFLESEMKTGHRANEKTVITVSK